MTSKDWLYLVSFALALNVPWLAGVFLFIWLLTQK